jgi:hypothetical protein
MIVALRIYRQHDLDLVTLACDKDFRFNRELKRVLIANANGTAYVPKPMPDIFDTEGYVPRVLRVQFSLSPDKPDEANAIALLMDIKTGYRCSFLKAIFRNEYLDLPVEAYTRESKFHLRKHLAYDGEAKTTEEKTDETQKAETETTAPAPTRPSEPTAFVDVPKPTKRQAVTSVTGPATPQPTGPAAPTNAADEENLDALFEKLNNM